MKPKEAFALCEKLNAPFNAPNPIAPNPYAVVKIDGVHEVVHLPTGKIEGKDMFIERA